MATIVVVILFLYGGYSIWDNWRIENHALLSRELLQYKPTPENTESLADLIAINEDVRGWITIDDTHIDYPLVQGEDDMEYVNKDVHGDFALSGAIFLSNVNSPDLSDPYSLIYGHHMDNGGMFGDIIEFVDEEYFDQHRSGSIVLTDRSYTLEIFAVLDTDASDYVVYAPKEQAEDCSGLLGYLQEKAVHYRDVGVTKDDRIVGLSTCWDAVSNGRVIVYGRLVNEMLADNGGMTNGYEKE